MFFQGWQTTWKARSSGSTWWAHISGDQFPTGEFQSQPWLTLKKTHNSSVDVWRSPWPCILPFSCVSLGKFSQEIYFYLPAIWPTSVLKVFKVDVSSITHISRNKKTKKLWLKNSKFWIGNLVVYLEKQENNLREASFLSPMSIVSKFSNSNQNFLSGFL